MNWANIARGALALLVSLFTMPVKTARVAMSELSKIGESGAMNTANDFPHLSWIKAVLPVIATVISICIVLYGIINVFVAPSYIGFGGRIGILIGSIITAIIVDWAIMLSGECLTTWIAVAQYVTGTRRNEKAPG